MSVRLFWNKFMINLKNIFNICKDKLFVLAKSTSSIQKISRPISSIDVIVRNIHDASCKWISEEESIQHYSINISNSIEARFLSNIGIYNLVIQWNYNSQSQATSDLIKLKSFHEIHIKGECLDIKNTQTYIMSDNLRRQ